MNKHPLLSVISCLLCGCLCLGLAMPAWAVDEDPEDWNAESIESEEEIPEPQEEALPEPEFAEDEEELPEEPEEPEAELWEPLTDIPDTVRLLPPEEGWQEVSTFILVSDWPCMAALSQDGGESWELLTPEPAEEGWAFTAWELWEDSLLFILPLGDANWDGWVDETDLEELQALLLSQDEADLLTLLALDLDQSGTLTILDLVRLKTAVLGGQPPVWNPDETI